MAEAPPRLVPRPWGLPVPRRDRDDWPVPWRPVWGTADGLRRRIEDVALRGTLWGVGRLPEPAIRFLVGALSWVAPLVDRHHARAARGFLVQALGPLEPRELSRRVRQAYRHLFRVVVDVDRFDRLVPFERTPEHFEVSFSPEAERVARSEGGAVLVGGHLGNWEMAPAIAPWIGFDPLYGVAKPVKNLPLSKRLQESRERRGIRLLPRRGAMKDAQAIVSAGGSLALLLDQRARKRPVLAPFFGRPARCDRSVGVLLKRLQVPVVLGTCLCTERPLHYRVEVGDVLWPDQLSGKSPEEISALVNRFLEQRILEHPEQYFWLHDRYRDTPLELSEDSLETPQDGLRGRSGLSSGEAPQDGHRAGDGAGDREGPSE